MPLGRAAKFDDKGCGTAFSAQSMVISQACIRTEGQLGKDKSFKEMIEKLKTDLTQKAKKKYHITIA